MSEDVSMIAFCGLYCGDCPMHQGKIADLARDLRKELRKNKFAETSKGMSKIPFMKEFADYEKCYTVLGLMVKMRCGKVCRDGGGNPFCKIRKCCEKKGIEGCWECDEFKECNKFGFLEDVHGKACTINLNRIRESGKEKFLAGKKLWFSK